MVEQLAADFYGDVVRLASLDADLRVVAPVRQEQVLAVLADYQ